MGENGVGVLLADILHQRRVLALQPDIAGPLVQILLVCYKLGAGNVVVHYLDLPTMKIHAQYRPDEEVRKVENWEAEFSSKPLRSLRPGLWRPYPSV